MMDRDIDYVELAKELGIRGRIAGNQLYARCPLHNEKRPSWDMNIHTGAWTCHAGCGPANGRDFARLVILVKGFTATEAERWIETVLRKPDNAMLQQRINQLMAEAEAKSKLPELPPDWQAYYSALSTSIMPIPFLRRGFDWDTINLWGIRYDTVRDQVVIPVRSYQPKTGANTLVGLVSRWMDPPPGRPKYENNPGFQKSHFLFGYGPQLAGGAITIVEGPLDAIWLQKHGYPAVSTFGTSLSNEQIDILRKGGFGPIILGADNDGPGLEYTESALDKLVDAGYLYHHIEWVSWEPHKDPNDCQPEELAHAYIHRRKALEVKLGRIS